MYDKILNFAHTLLMKKASACALFICALAFIFACAFTTDPASSLKSLTKPYAATYECTRATLGDKDLLEDYDYFKIIISDTDTLTLEMRKSGGKKSIFKCPCSYDEKTGCLTAEAGILGFSYKQKTKIENGKFVISMPILSKQLTMLFEQQ